MLFARVGHTASVLLNNKILVADGSNGSNFLNTAELYDSSTGNWTSVSYMIFMRGDHTVSVLADGKVIAIGGCDDSSYLNSTEIYYS